MQPSWIVYWHMTRFTFSQESPPFHPGGSHDIHTAVMHNMPWGDTGRLSFCPQREGGVSGLQLLGAPEPV
jgi:hypothetical protein